MATTEVKSSVDPLDAQLANNAATQKLVGIIEPPPDLKQVVDRTADFVRRVGVAFEGEIVQRNGRSKKFEFLQATSPYHAYYRQRIQYGPDGPPKEGAPAQDNSMPPPPPPAAAVEIEEEKPVEPKADLKKVKRGPARKVVSLLDKMLGIIKESRAPNVEPEEPRKMVYTVIPPPANVIAAIDIDIIKLTAQFVARNGRTFLQGLSQREARNPQFDFLKPQHPFFTFFQRLVEAYSQVVKQPANVISRLKKFAANRDALLSDVLGLVKHEQNQLEKQRVKNQSEEEERVAMQLIDWHSFVIVETITFGSHDEEYLPAPKNTIDEMNRMLAAQDGSAPPASDSSSSSSGPSGKPLDTRPVGEQDMEVEMDMDTEDQKEDEDEDAEERAAEKKKDNYVPPRAEDEPEPEIIRAEDLEKRKKGMSKAEKSVKFQKCPVCGQDIPVDDLSEHMRIELLDPKWKQQKEALKDKQKQSSLAQSDSIAANLSRLARRRADVFVGEDEKRDEEAEREADRQAAATWESAKTAQQAQIAQQQQQQAQSQSLGALLKSSKAASAATPAGKPGAPKAIPLPATAPTAAGRAIVSTTLSVNALPLPATAPGQPHLPGGGGGGFRPGPPGTGAMPPMFGHHQPPPMQPFVPRGPLPLAMSAPIPGNFVAPGLEGAFPSLDEQQSQSQAAANKRQKVKAQETVSEDQWATQHPGPAFIKILVPNEPSKDQTFQGQTIDLTVEQSDSLNTVKDRLAAQMSNFPAKKMKLSLVTGPGSTLFLKEDGWTVAKYNIASGSQLSLGIKERGGKNR